MNSTEMVLKICKERKIPLSKLEKACGFANGYLGRLKKDLPIDRANKIAEYFDIDLDYLMTGKEDNNFIPDDFEIDDFMIKMSKNPDMQIVMEVLKSINAEKLIDYAKYLHSQN